MKKNSLLILIFILLSKIYSQDNEKISIIVYDFKVGKGIKQDIAIEFSEMLRLELMKPTNISVVSKDYVEKLKNELLIQEDNLALEFGKTPMAKIAVSGEISYFNSINKYSITIDVINFETLETIIKTNIAFKKNQIESSICNLAKTISRSIDNKKPK